MDVKNKETLVQNFILQPPPLQSNYKIIDYEPIREIGVGSFGKVILMRKKKNLQFLRSEEFVTVKILSKKRNKLAEILNEINILKIIQPSCKEYMLCYLGEDEDNENWYIFTEYILDAVTLRYLQNSGYFKNNDAELKKCIIQLINGLYEIHKIGIAHRDIKSDNILVQLKKDEIVGLRYIDFGISCSIVNKNTVCSKHVLMGTPSYMSPEIVEKKTDSFDIWKKTDLWALSITLYETILSSHKDDLRAYPCEMKYTGNDEKTIELTFIPELKRSYHPCYLWINSFIGKPDKYTQEYIPYIEVKTDFVNRYPMANRRWFSDHNKLFILFFLSVWSIHLHDDFINNYNQYVKDKLQHLFSKEVYVKILLLFSKNAYLRRLTRI